MTSGKPRADELLREVRSRSPELWGENSSGTIRTLTLTTTPCYQARWTRITSDLRKLHSRRSWSRIGIPLGHPYHGCALPTELGGQAVPS